LHGLQRALPGKWNQAAFQGMWTVNRKEVDSMTPGVQITAIICITILVISILGKFGDKP